MHRERSCSDTAIPVPSAPTNSGRTIIKLGETLELRLGRLDSDDKLVLHS